MKSIRILVLILLTGCTQVHCKDLRKNEPQDIQAQEKILADKNPFDRVKVYKLDGSVQCSQGGGIALDVMEKDLQSVTVFEREKQHDGMMRIQKCGTPTGQCNVYTIDKSFLNEALKRGFKQWTRE